MASSTSAALSSLKKLASVFPSGQLTSVPKLSCGEPSGDRAPPSALTAPSSSKKAAPVPYVSVISSSEMTFLDRPATCIEPRTLSSNDTVMLRSSPSAETSSFAPLAASSSFHSETTETAFLGASSAEATPLEPLAPSAGTAPSGDLSPALQSAIGSLEQLQKDAETDMTSLEGKGNNIIALVSGFMALIMTLSSAANTRCSEFHILFLVHLIMSLGGLVSLGYTRYQYYHMLVTWNVLNEELRALFNQVDTSQPSDLIGRRMMFETKYTRDAFKRRFPLLFSLLPVMMFAVLSVGIFIARLYLFQCTCLEENGSRRTCGGTLAPAPAPMTP